jgi:hypothetical protein
MSDKTSPCESLVVRAQTDAVCVDSECLEYLIRKAHRLRGEAMFDFHRRVFLRLSRRRSAARERAASEEAGAFGAERLFDVPRRIWQALLWRTL